MGPQCTHIALHVRDLEPCVEFYREFCGLRLIRERGGGAKRVVWLAEPGREGEFIFVLIPGGPGRAQADNDFSHLGFALESKHHALIVPMVLADGLQRDAALKLHVRALEYFPHPALADDLERVVPALCGLVCTVWSGGLFGRTIGSRKKFPARLVSPTGCISLTAT